MIPGASAKRVMFRVLQPSMQLLVIATTAIMGCGGISNPLYDRPKIQRKEGKSKRDLLQINYYTYYIVFTIEIVQRKAKKKKGMNFSAKFLFQQIPLRLTIPFLASEAKAGMSLHLGSPGSSAKSLASHYQGICWDIWSTPLI